MGRLSNPTEATKALLLQKSTKLGNRKITSHEANTRPVNNELAVPTAEEGRLSNSVQRRLAGVNIDHLVEDYGEGLSINRLLPGLNSIAPLS